MASMIDNDLTVLSKIVNDFEKELDLSKYYVFSIYQRDELLQGKFAIRPYLCDGGVPKTVKCMVLTDTLKEARLKIPNKESLVCIRAGTDDPVNLVESWLKPIRKK